MPYTLSVVKKMVMDIIGEDSSSPTYWTSSNDIELEDYINDAVEEVCVLSGVYTQDLLLPLHASRDYYSLDPGKGGEFLYVNSVRVIPEGYSVGMSDPLKLTREDYNWMTRTGTPRTFFFVNPDMLRVVPMSSTEGQSLEILASTIPPTYTLDSEVIDLDESLISVVVAYAASMIFLSMRAFPKASLWSKVYMEGIGRTSKEGTSFLGRAQKIKDLGSANENK